MDSLTQLLQKNLEFYISHTKPNDAGIDEIIDSAQRLGTFEQCSMKSWIFRGIASVGHILNVSRNPHRYLLCYANYPYQVFATLDDSQKRMLALDILLYSDRSNLRKMKRV